MWSSRRPDRFSACTKALSPRVYQRVHQLATHDAGTVVLPLATCVPACVSAWFPEGGTTRLAVPKGRTGDPAPRSSPSHTAVVRQPAEQLCRNQAPGSDVSVGKEDRPGGRHVLLAAFGGSRPEPGWRGTAPPANQSVPPSAGARMAARRTQYAALPPSPFPAARAPPCPRAIQDGSGPATRGRSADPGTPPGPGGRRCRFP